MFTCPFHAWTYDCDGALVGAAYQYAPYAYDGGIDREQWGLTPVAQFKNYYGSLWATWDPKAPSFEDYVGPFAEGIRYDCEASDGEEAGIEVFRPFQKWRLPTNWKVPAFSSSTDLTHAAMTHRSVNAASIGPDRGTMSGGERHRRRAPFPSDRYAVGDHNLGHGGNWTVYQQPGVPEYVDTWFEAGVDDYFREARDRKAEKYADRILPPHGHEGGHFCVFPNFIMDSWRWRWWHPHTVGVVERWSLFGVDREAPKHVKDAVRHYVMRYNGPTGATESDDMENWNYVYAASQGARGAQAQLLLRERLGPRHRERPVPRRRVQRLAHRGGAPRALQPVAGVHGSVQLGRPLPGEQGEVAPHLVGAQHEGSRGMTERANASLETMDRVVLLKDIEQFLYWEALLLDERRLTEWLDLLAEDIHYWMPIRRNVKFGDWDLEYSDPDSEISYFDEGKDILTGRVHQINSGVHWAEEPVSRFSHIVSNILLLEVNGDEVRVSSKFFCYQNRLQDEVNLFVGRRYDTLRRDPDTVFKIAKRDVILDQNVLLPKVINTFF